MAPSWLNRSLGYRAEQTGFLIATGNVPLTFQRTVMPRKAIDQALITGLLWAANYGTAIVIQELVQSAALQNRELLRSTSVERHGTADTSPSAAPLTQWLEEEPERASEVLTERLRALARTDFVATGGVAAEALVGRA